MLESAACVAKWSAIRFVDKTGPTHRRVKTQKRSSRDRFFSLPVYGFYAPPYLYTFCVFSFFVLSVGIYIKGTCPCLLPIFVLFSRRPHSVFLFNTQNVYIYTLYTECSLTGSSLFATPSTTTNRRVYPLWILFLPHQYTTTLEPSSPKGLCFIVWPTPELPLGNRRALANPETKRRKHHRDLIR